MYAFERAHASLEPAMTNEFKKNKAAWKYFETQSPYYRRLAAWYVISAKRQETRDARLKRLIDDSARGERLAPFRPDRGNSK